MHLLFRGPSRFPVHTVRRTHCVGRSPSLMTDDAPGAPQPAQVTTARLLAALTQLLIFPIDGDDLVGAACFPLKQRNCEFLQFFL